MGSSKKDRGGKRSGTPVKRLKNYKNAIIPNAKLKNYILNPTKDKDKAKLFNSMGYNMSNFNRLADDIKAELKNNTAIRFKANKHGTAYQVDMWLGITEKKHITTAWNVRKGENKPRFITAYRKRGKNE